MRGLERTDACRELCVVVRQGGCNRRDRLLTLLEDERCAVRRRDSQKEERPCSILVKNFNLIAHESRPVSSGSLCSMVLTCPMND